MMERIARKTLAVGYGALGILVAIPLLWGFIYPDIWWQLREGYELLAQGRLLTAPLQAFGLPNHPFPHEYVFYEILIAAVHRATGWAGLRVFFAIIAAFPFGYAAWQMRRYRQWSFIHFYLLTAGYFLLLLRIQQRPELLTNVFLILCAHGLLVFPRRFEFFFLLMALWANTHASFIVGFAAIGFWIVNDWACSDFKIARRHVVLGLASLAGCLLNPSGFLYLFEPLKLQSATWSKLTSGEMEPLSPMGYPLLLAASVLGGMILWRAGIRRHVWLAALLGTTMLLTLQSHRYMNMVGDLLCVLVFVNAREKAPWTQTRLRWDWGVTLFLIIPLLGVMAVLLAPTVPLNFFAADYTKRASAPLIASLPDKNKKVLTEICTGAYLQGNTRRLRTFIDTGFNRFSQDNLRYYYYLDQSPEALEAVLTTLDVDEVIVGKLNHHWSFVLNGHPRWQLAKVKGQSLLYERRAAGAATDAAATGAAPFSYAPYAPGLMTVRGTLSVLNDDESWREEKFYAFFLWWLKRQDAGEIRTFLRSGLKMQPGFELTLLHVLGEDTVVEAKMALKRYQPRDDFDRLIRAYFYASAGKQKAARRALPRFNFADVGSMWRNALVQTIEPQKNFERFVWSEENEKWLMEFSRALSRR